jgi:uncharacterized membrane protein
MSVTQDFRDAFADSWNWFSNLDLISQNWALGWILCATLMIIVLSVLAWKVMLPLILVAVGVMSYLRRSRTDDSL